MGHSRAILGHIWATLGHLGSFLAISGPFCGIFGQISGKFKFVCGIVGVTRLAFRMYGLRHRLFCSGSLDCSIKYSPPHITPRVIKVYSALRERVGNPEELAPLNQVRGFHTKSRLHGTNFVQSSARAIRRRCANCTTAW